MFFLCAHVLLHTASSSVVQLFPIVISFLRVHRSIMVALHVTPCLASQSPAVHIYLVCSTSKMCEGSSRRCRSEAGQGSCLGRCMENEAVKRRARLGNITIRVKLVRALVCQFN